MLEKYSKIVILNNNYLKQLKFIFLIFLLLGINNWVFEQNSTFNSENNLSTEQISPLGSPKGERNSETDVSEIQYEDSNDETYLIQNEDEGGFPLITEKIMESGSQAKDVIWFYDNLTPEDRKKIRQAMDYAIPRDQIISDIKKDSALKVASPISQEQTGVYDPTIQARSYDKEIALDLLEEVFGYRYNETTDPYFDMTFMAPTSRDDRMQWATLTAQTFGEIGINVELKLWNWDYIIPRMFDPAVIGFDFFHEGFDAFFIGWNSNPNMNHTVLYHSDSFVPNGQNYNFLNSSIADSFLNQAYSAVQLDDRIQALKDFQAWFSDEVPKSMILQLINYYGIDPLLEGFDPYLVRYGPWLSNVTLGAQTDLTYTIPSSFYNFNPACSSSDNDGVWANNVYLSLAERRGIYNSTHYVPLVAESWKSSPDGLVWNVTIREGIKWDDGTNLTVDDVIYTYHTQFQDTTQSTNQFLLQSWFPNNETDIIKLNESTIQFTLGSFNPFIESQIFGFEILQKAQMEMITNWRTDNTNYGNTKLYGCGPYMFKSYNGYDTIELEINPYYNQEIFGHEPHAIGGGVWWPNASIPTVYFKERFNAEEAITGLETGTIDIIDYTTYLHSYIEEIEASTWGKLVISLSGGVQELGYNQYSPIWGINPKDPRTMYPEHDLEVLLETLSDTVVNEVTPINATILNYGWTNETNVELQIWINEALVTSHIYPSLSIGETETFSYQWIPSDYGEYNITAYILPVTNETLIRNNNMTIMTNLVRYVFSGPIYIYSNDQLNSTFPGMGTIDDPIRIEWLNITTSSGTLIYISNTNFNFRIANCILNGLSYANNGIYLANVQNCTIENNTVFNVQGWAGIALYSGSDNCSIIGNQVFSNGGNGILLDHSNNINVINNSAYDNNYPGIRLDTANDNYIYNNSLYLNRESAIWLFNDNFNNEILNNTVYNNHHGIFLLTSDDNVVANNLFSNNDDGIILSESDNNLISKNFVYSSLYNGISLERSKYNTISGNIINDNDGYGIRVAESNENNLTGNFVFNNINGGIYTWDSNNQVISNNIIHNNGGTGHNEGTGISLSNTHECTILNNTIYDNNFAGMVLGDSDNNIIRNNTIYNTIGGNNNRRGIALWTCGYNYISNNTVYNSEFGIQINPYDFSIKENNQAIYNTIFNNVNGLMVGGTNNQITNNLIFNNELGMQIDQSVGNHISFNTIYDNGWLGIYAESANYVTISNNTLHDNGGHCGVNIRGSSNCIIKDNTIFSTQGDGILIEAGEGESNQNVITGNTIYDNPDTGIKLFSSNYNTLSGNHIYNNAINGINLGDSDHNIISDNVIENNPNEGIYLENSDYNTIMRNHFVSGPNANDHGSNNIFILNYWAGWTSPDADGDGIVDNPYSIGSENQDLYPLVSPDVHAFAPPSFSSQIGGLSLSGTITIQWVCAVDSLGHPITYAVSYSSDGGNTWVSLQTELISTSYEWDTKTVSNGNDYLIRVVATCSEGFTKEDTSGRFTIDNVKPTTTISTTTTSKSGPGFTGFMIILSILSLLILRRKNKKNI